VAYAGDSASAAADSSWSPPSDSGSGDSAGGAGALLEQRPEFAVGGAFVGGFALAMILKRLAR
jgi:hypothetical protein